MKINNETAEAIRLLEERLLQPNVRSSADALSELLADEFIEFGSFGQTFNKKQVIEGLLREKQTQISLFDFNTIDLAPGVILATYYAVTQKSDKQEVCSLRSSIWKLVNNKWQMIFHQGTNTELKLSS